MKKLDVEVAEHIENLAEGLEVLFQKMIDELDPICSFCMLDFTNEEVSELLACLGELKDNMNLLKRCKERWKHWTREDKIFFLGKTLSDYCPSNYTKLLGNVAIRSHDMLAPAFC